MEQLVSLGLVNGKENIFDQSVYIIQIMFDDYS